MDASQSNKATTADPASQLEDKVAALRLSQDVEDDDSSSNRTIEEVISSSFKPVKAEDISFRNYKDENDLDVIIDLVAPYLSEPYSVYCYRYFLHGWYVLTSILSSAQADLHLLACMTGLNYVSW